MDKNQISSLAAKRIVVTRAERQSAGLLGELEALGALPSLLPLVAFAAPEDYGPMDAALDQLESFDWIIFTSENAVRAVTAIAIVTNAMPMMSQP